jgi:hypothetical protein
MTVDDIEARRRRSQQIIEDSIREITKCLDVILGQVRQLREENDA